MLLGAPAAATRLEKVGVGAPDQLFEGIGRLGVLGKKPAQKTLKERRAEKRAAAKHNRAIDV